MTMKCEHLNTTVFATLAGDRLSYEVVCLTCGKTVKHSVRRKTK